MKKLIVAMMFMTGCATLPPQSTHMAFKSVECQHIEQEGVNIDICLEEFTVRQGCTLLKAGMSDEDIGLIFGCENAPLPKKATDDSLTKTIK